MVEPHTGIPCMLPTAAEPLPDLLTSWCSWWNWRLGGWRPTLTVSRRFLTFQIGK